MYSYSVLCVLFCVLCVPVLPHQHPQPGRAHQPNEPGCPQDGYPGDTDDTLPPPGSENRPVPEHSFDKKVLHSNTGDKKVFIKFDQGPFTFKKRREKAGRVTFTCNGCQKFNKYLPVVAWHEQHDDDPENYEYILDVDTLPSLEEHVCCSTGIEDMVQKFRSELELQAQKDPTQPFPTLYQTVRASFTRSLTYDLKLLFLAQIPSYDTVQTSLYRIRRSFIPAAPVTQSELDINLDWFLVNHETDESLVKGDVLHSDGLRVLLFSTDESLNILARAQTVLCDGTL